MSNTAMIVLMIVLLVLLIVVGPLAVIWSLNTLFPVLAIPYTLWTWLATLILSAALAPSIKVPK